MQYRVKVAAVMWRNTLFMNEFCGARFTIKIKADLRLAVLADRG